MNSRLAIIPVVIVAGVLLLSAAAPVSSTAHTATATASVWVDVASGTPKNPCHVNNVTLPCVALAFWGTGLSSGSGYGYGGGPVTGSWIVLDSKLHVNRSGSWSYAGSGTQKLAPMGTFTNGTFLWALTSTDFSVIRAGTFKVAGCKT
jgi:hypothetical protein